MSKLPSKTKAKNHLAKLKLAINLAMFSEDFYNPKEKQLSRKAYLALSELYNRLHRHLL